jgi:hypothetical protein
LLANPRDLQHQLLEVDRVVAIHHARMLQREEAIQILTAGDQTSD